MFYDTPTTPTLPDQIETDRLILRPPRMGDGVLVNAAIQESFPELTQWLAWATHMPSIAESETWVREASARWRTRQELPLLMFRRKDGLLVGSTGMHNISWSVPRFEIGYWIRTSLQGKGYMTEAVNAQSDFCFDTLGAIRMEIRCDAKNIRSAAVAQRVGYTLDATLRWDGRDFQGNLRDTLIFSKLRPA